MKKTMSLLVVTTALTAAIGVPAWSTIRNPGEQGEHSMRTLFQDGAQSVQQLFASYDDDDDHRGRRGDHDRYDDDDDHRGEHRRGHDDDDDDDDDYGSNANNAAPAGTVAPPQNGLFQNGTPPRVQMN